MMITDASINEHKHEPPNYQPVENFNFLLLSSLVQSHWWTEFYVNVSVCGFIWTHTDASVITGIHKYCYQRSSSTESLSIVPLQTYAFKYCFPAGSYCFILCIMSSWLCYSLYTVNLQSAVYSCFCWNEKLPSLFYCLVSVTLHRILISAYSDIIKTH